MAFKSIEPTGREAGSSRWNGERKQCPFYKKMPGLFHLVSRLLQHEKQKVKATLRKRVEPPTSKENNQCFGCIVVL